MMFIYFIEQVWTFSFSDSNGHNFETAELSRTYWGMWGESGYKNTHAYPPEHMVEDVDYIDY